MYHTLRTRWQLRLVNASFVLLFLIAVALLQWVSREYHLQFDWTQARRTSLSEASRAVLERLDGPITVTAFASQRGDIRRNIRDLIGRYQRVRPGIALNFVDPDAEPERVRAAGVQFEGQLLLEYANGRETISPQALNEETVTNALTRLGRRGERWLVFLSGHGERSPDRQANFDLSTWATQLRQRGFNLRTLALGEHPQIPQNTTALVIAGPRTRLLKGELKTIDSYVRAGGNLLWLADPGGGAGFESLAELLGVEFQPGVVVDPASAAITGNPTAIVVTRYGSHPVVKNFSDVTVFPHAAAISLRAAEGWNGTVLLDTRPSAWAETGAVDEKMVFDKGKDIPGPLTLGVALTRERENREQRIAVLGDGDFLSNSIIANGGNLDLGMSLANWVSQDDPYVSIPTRAARDKTLNLPQTAQVAIAAGFLVVLPLAFAAAGVAVWLRRRRR